MKKKLKWGAIGFGGLIVLLTVIGVFVGGSEESEVPQVTSPTTAPTPQAERSPRQTIGDAVIKALGKSNREVEGAFSDSHQVQAVVLSDERAVTVQWAINDNLTSGLRKGGARRDVVDILKAVHESGVPYESILVVGTFPLVDLLGNASETPVVRAVYDQSTVEQINWDGFQSDNVYRIADGEFGAIVHKDFRD